MMSGRPSVLVVGPDTAGKAIADLADTAAAEPPSAPPPPPDRSIPLVQMIWRGTAHACTLCYLRKMVRAFRSFDGALSHFRSYHKLDINPRSFTELSFMRVELPEARS